VQDAGVSTEVFALGLPSELTPRYPLKAGDPAAVWNAFRAGEAVLISEPLAWHRRLAVGDTLTLRTDSGPQRLPIAGVYYDYGTEHGQVLMPRPLYDRYFEDRGVSALGLYLEPGVDPDQVITAVRRLVAAQGKGQEVLVRGTREIREMSLAIFDRTFTITQVLRLLAVLVAFVGILSAFMALQLERAKELATLRAIGLTPLQVGGLVTLQTTFMGLVAGLLAIPTGLVLAEVLIHVINRRSFGWSMQTLVAPQVLIEAVLLALFAAALAGLYPGWKMAHTSPAVALREE
jgi:putative ABC transport system permease protein